MKKHPLERSFPFLGTWKVLSFFLISLSVFFVCNGGVSQVSAATVTITSFNANPSLIVEGGSSTLSVSATGGSPTVCQLYGQYLIGQISANNGSRSVSPTETTTYRVECWDFSTGGPVASRTLEVRVEINLGVWLNCQDARKCTTNSSTVYDCCWDVSGTFGGAIGNQYARNCTLSSYTTPLNGCSGYATSLGWCSQSHRAQISYVSPTGGGEFELYGYDPNGGSVSATITCDGIYGRISGTDSTGNCTPPPPPPPAPTLDFTVREIGNPGNSASNGGSINIPNGKSATLSWTSSDATSCTAVTTSPNESWNSGGSTSSAGVSTGNLSYGFYQYTLRCDGSGGSRTRTVYVIVNPDLTIDNSDGPVSVATGDTMDIKWKAVHCLGNCSCLPTSGAGWAISPKNLTGGNETVTATATSLYTLRCSGPGGTGSDSVQVNVGATPTLTVTVDALPDFGTVPPSLNSNVTAVIGGTATGPINYAFDCGNGTTQSFPNESATSKTYTCTYASAGSYTPIVTAIRQGVPASGNDSVTVNAAANPAVCGSAHGSTFATQPTTNLCDSTASSILVNPPGVTGSGPWSWKCRNTVSLNEIDCLALYNCPTNGCEARTCTGKTCNNGCNPNASGTKYCPPWQEINP